jgi:hypothetical protein
MQYDKALKCIAKGLTKHSGMAELYWMAGLACYWMGQSNMGVFWSINAIMLGKYHGIGKEIQRIGFNCPKGLYEGPFEVLNHCYRALGQQDLAEQAQNNFDLAVAARHAICK